ncbi:ATPase [Mycobacterium sp. 852013-51886_SCH5428379]|uniref:SRPBCC family protein n=1 Tax=Mycobacterium sp. 852013-51886_SCH5428379 TaxID=1834111 RepID=UPI000801E60F|nr:SRPBCC family protein [Mycobacterium sp. 852013-51886_SCH5428379]OBB59214.1 ATPase [Mycobacterium sp. 852013-51886_SCH5428379]
MNAGSERYVVTRRIAAPTADVFAVLADPGRHQDTEPGDWVRTALEGRQITQVGQIFGMNMYLEQIGGHYVMHNLVKVFEPERTIEWLPGQLDESGAHDAAGWSWRYDLAPAADGTEVTLTYDWSATPDALRAEIGGLPPFPEEYLAESLATLDRAVTGEGTTKSQPPG